MGSKERFLEKLQTIPGLKIGTTDDPLKITLRHGFLTGYELQTDLEKSGIYPELADPYQVLLLLPLLNRD